MKNKWILFISSPQMFSWQKNDSKLSFAKSAIKKQYYWKFHYELEIDQNSDYCSYTIQINYTNL